MGVKRHIDIDIDIRSIDDYNSVTERRLTTFGNKIWRMICGPKLDINSGK